MNEDCVDLIWSTESIEDRGDIYEFLFEWSSEFVADRTDDEFVKSTSNLKLFPEMGVKKSGMKGLQLVLTAVPYIISYEFDEEKNVVKILRVLSQKAIKRQ